MLWTVWLTASMSSTPLWVALAGVFSHRASTGAAQPAAGGAGFERHVP